MGPLGYQEILIILLLPLVLVWPAWRVVQKTGNPGALALLGFVPLVNILLLLYLAFSKWPIEREVEQLRIGIK